eukprot:1184492-Prorocentrum_minimum.AAC.1
MCMRYSSFELLTLLPSRFALFLATRESEPRCYPTRLGCPTCDWLAPSSFHPRERGAVRVSTCARVGGGAYVKGMELQAGDGRDAVAEEAAHVLEDV